MYAENIPSASRAPSRARLGIGSVVLVALLSLIFGGIAGALVASRTAGTKIVKEVVSSGTTTPASITAAEAAGPPMSWAEVARRDGPAVVTIVNQQQPQQDLFGGMTPGATDEGSGFIIDKRGDIITNDHVVASSQSLSVVFADGHKAPATIVREAQASDLAVIRVHAAVPAVLTWGDSSKLQPGEPVLAIGSALGQYRNTVTAGVLSAEGRTIQEPNGVSLPNLLQTDAAINQGNSGGPLLNDHGQVVGINTAITRGSQQTDPFGFSSGSDVVAEGLGFAIASNTAHNVVDQLVQNKPTAFLGVKYAPVSSQDATLYNFPVGAYVITVEPGTPAARAGLKARDVITAVAGAALSDTFSLQEAISQHAPGESVKLRVWRNGKTFTVKVKLGADRSK